MWFGPSDIYVAAKTLSGTWKFTVHYANPPRFPSPVRYFGYTSEFAKRATPDGQTVTRSQRSQLEPSFHPISSDVWLEALVRIPDEELRVFTSDSEDVIWLPAPQPAHMTEFLLVSTPIDFAPERLLSAQNAPGFVFEGALERCGRRAWLLVQEREADLGELADVRSKLKRAWPLLDRPAGLGGNGTRAVFFGTVNETIAAMYEVAADSF